ncbi:hypothetical protein [Mycoplasmopsis edwardii]|uniref:Uncharacterized protein n=1 Tax=Mycoplasmopsis edwardii TaxID=53558 RepID=A0ACD4PJ25_9BACT|nr:hypothetical protein [Mycoplasmopsis edwardii]WBP84068.1 hypothetical protein Me_995_000014 [Mycoplasmopsis edwardii]
MKKFIKTLLIAPVFGAIPAFVVSCSKETVEQKEEKYINLNIDFAKKTASLFGQEGNQKDLIEAARKEAQKVLETVKKESQSTEKYMEFLDSAIKELENRLSK